MKSNEFVQNTTVTILIIHVNKKEKKKEEKKILGNVVKV